MFDRDRDRERDVRAIATVRFVTWPCWCSTPYAARTRGLASHGKSRRVEYDQAELCLDPRRALRFRLQRLGRV
jgi:hypothetical protein